MTRAAPRYQIDEVVYLRASAALGELESYRVGAVQDRGIGWVYQIFIDSRPPAEWTLGDRIDLKEERLLFFTEEELVSLCEALDLAATALAGTIARVKSQIDDFCANTGDEPPVFTARTPRENVPARWSVGDEVAIEASAKRGFVEIHNVTNIHKYPQQNVYVYELDIFGDRRERAMLGKCPGIPVLNIGLDSYQKTGYPRDGYPKQLYFQETELMTKCEALEMAEGVLERKLIYIMMKHAAFCEG